MLGLVKGFHVVGGYLLLERFRLAGGRMWCLNIEINYVLLILTNWKQFCQYLGDTLTPLQLFKCKKETIGN